MPPSPPTKTKRSKFDQKKFFSRHIKHMCMQLGNNRDGARVKMYHGATFRLFFMHIGSPKNFKNYFSIFIVFQKSTKDNEKRTLLN